MRLAVLSPNSVRFLCERSLRRGGGGGRGGEGSLREAASGVDHVPVETAPPIQPARWEENGVISAA
jgi:hypothetical protein